MSRAFQRHEWGKRSTTHMNTKNYQALYGGQGMAFKTYATPEAKLKTHCARSHKGALDANCNACKELKAKCHETLSRES